MIPSMIGNFVKIKEGNTYPFQITGIVNLPDGTEYFTLSDPNNVKHLLEKRHYHHYCFEIGQSISCRIDKINCNGKIYIEPLHPYYRLGKAYDFPVLKIERSGNGKDAQVAVLEDVFCNEIRLSVNYFPELLEVGQLLKLKVVRIKKGLVYLSEPGFNREYSGMILGMEYPFTLKDFIDLQGDRSYFILTSGGNSLYKLRYKYYEKYGLNVGQIVSCRFIRSGKEFLLEPRHPLYQINGNYEFEIAGEETIKDYPAGERKVYLLRNDFGKSIMVPAEQIKSKQISDGKLYCKVRDIRKGRVYLNCRK
jgi:hypothetical protein